MRRNQQCHSSADANASGLIVLDDTAYVTTSGNCGGVDNGLWALNLATKK